jgi:2-polyprenyl-6-methoxyphenol hydroxylase-like FAD-dependent oxidoreductase
MSTKRLRAAIVGGGIGGLSAANAMLRRGIDVTVSEQGDPLKEVGTGLSIFPNGLRQLERWDYAQRWRKSARRSGRAQNITGATEPLWVKSSPKTRAVGRASMECTDPICCGYSPKLSHRLRYAPAIVASGSNRMLLPHG